MFRNHYSSHARLESSAIMESTMSLLSPVVDLTPLAKSAAPPSLVVVEESTWSSSYCRLVSSSSTVEVVMIDDGSDDDCWTLVEEGEEWLHLHCSSSPSKEEAPPSRKRVRFASGVSVGLAAPILLEDDFGYSLKKNPTLTTDPQACANVSFANVSCANEPATTTTTVVDRSALWYSLAELQLMKRSAREWARHMARTLGEDLCVSNAADWNLRGLEDFVSRQAQQDKRNRKQQCIQAILHLQQHTPGDVESLRCMSRHHSRQSVARARAGAKLDYLAVQRQQQQDEASLVSSETDSSSSSSDWSSTLELKCSSSSRSLLVGLELSS